jgi:hypothetical protein
LDAYHQAVSSDRADDTPIATFELGRRLAKEGDLAGARGACNRDAG